MMVKSDSPSLKPSSESHIGMRGFSTLSLFPCCKMSDNDIFLVELLEDCN